MTCSIPKTYDFCSRYKNDTSNAVSFIVTQTVSDVTTPIDLTGVAIDMHIKVNKQSATAVKTLSIGNGITVTDAVNGEFRIDAFICDLNAYKYHYDLQFTFPDGTVRTYIRGNFEVIEDVTKI